jgi:O-antigen/teichoic acid export membrane protein
MKLFNKLLNGSMWLLFREVINIFIRILGVFILIKFLTPQQYGVYSIAVVIANCIAQIANMGLNTHIVKYNGDIKKVINSFSSFSVYTSISVTFISYLLIPVFSIITHVNWTVFALIFPTIPILILGTIPMGLIERQVEYKKISQLEIFSQIFYYVVTLLLIYLKMGVLAPVFGFIAMNTFYVFNMYRITGFHIVINDKTYFKEIWEFGFDFSIANASYQTRSLILPFIIAPITSPSIVGTIAFASRIAESLNIFKVSLGRISINAFSNLHNEGKSFIKAVKSTMSYQLIASGCVLLVFTMVAPFIFIKFIDEKWKDIIPLIPFLAFNTLCVNLIVAQTSALTIKGNVKYVTLNYLLQQILMIIGVYFFLPKFGIMGYGYALLLSTPAYILLSSLFFIYYKFNPFEPFLWFFSISAALLFGHINVVFYGLVFLPVFFKTCRSQLLFLIENIYKTAFKNLWWKNV